MTKLLLLIGASVRSQLRWAKEHVYSWLILTPLVFGITYLSVSRLAETVQSWPSSPMVFAGLAVFFEFCLIGLSLSRATAEIYHVRRPESFTDVLPVPASTHLHVGLAGRVGRNIIVALVLVAGKRLVGGEPTDPVDLVPLLFFILLTAQCEVFAALNWIHWNHGKKPGPVLAACLVVTTAAALAGLLLVAALKPQQLPVRLTVLLITGGLAIAAMYGLTRSAHQKWRATDIEYARRIGSYGRWSIFDARLFERRFSPSVAAQLARDLQLTLRAFSSAVYVVAGLAALWPIALLAALTTGVVPVVRLETEWFDSTWLPTVIATKVACALIATSLAALLPVLIAYELPHMWLERATGTTGLDIWQAKLWYARLVSAPAPVLAWLLGTLSGAVPSSYSIGLLAECFLVWWLASSLIGSLSFEIPTRPGLAIIMMSTVGVAGGIFAALLWPFGVIIYFQSMHSLADRGRERVRYYLITEGD